MSASMQYMLAVVIFGALVLGTDLVSSEEIMCYNCTLVEFDSFNSGPIGCKDPFDATGIATVPCTGKCSVSTMDGDMPLTSRGCKPAVECVDFAMEVDGSMMTQKCCAGNLCNGADASTDGEPPPVDVVPVDFDGLVCYNCTFTEMGTLISGQPGCKDPFDGTGIATIPCTGKCAVSTLAGDISSMIRGCMPIDECVDFSTGADEETRVSQSCCAENLCNGAAGNGQPPPVKINTDLVGYEGLVCYNCTHIELDSFSIGPVGCKEPFNATGIDKVPCSGKCAVSTMDGDVPSIMRGCKPVDECVDFSTDTDDSTITQKCCTGNLCNGAAGNSQPPAVNPDLVDYEGLVCYRCSHIESENTVVGVVGCKKPFNDTGIDKIPCSGKCSVTTMDGSLPSTVRDCKPADECMDFSQKDDDTTISMKCCTNNLCNDAGVVTYSLPIAIAAVITAVLF